MVMVMVMVVVMVMVMVIGAIFKLYPASNDITVLICSLYLYFYLHLLETCIGVKLSWI